ncbi:hypothetical protein JCM8097_001606 [Rhodosporidiobolus ruineniae]
MVISAPPSFTRSLTSPLPATTSSPTKRPHRASPTSSPDPSRSADAASPRVLRTKLDNAQDEVVRVEIRGQAAKEVAVAMKEVGGQRGAEEQLNTPSTPPETAVEPLVGLGVGLVEREGAASTASTPFKVVNGAAEGATQTATAERQVQELMAMSDTEHLALARLCSQYCFSEYNTLKRAVAAAANETTPAAPLPPVATFPPLPRIPSAPPSAQANSSRPALPPRPPPLVRAATDIPTRSTASVTPTKNPAPVASNSTLTPIMADFAFHPTPPTSTLPTPVSTALPAAPTTVRAVEAAKDLLADLVEGEPVVAERTARDTLVVSEAFPSPQKVNAPLPPALLPVAPPNIPGLLPGMTVVNGVPVKTSVSHPINISPLVPPELLSRLSSHLFSQSSSSSFSGILDGDAAPFLLRPSPSTDLLTLSVLHASAPSSFLPPSSSAPSRPLGNFVLSSCPGKKVRMNGEPIRGGRGAICRDVLLDLQRARDEHGVRLVVCCLDDAELAYLGSPWGEYSAAARKLGMEVVRMPMVEGFAPESPAMLDAHLGRIVKDYTLRGKSVLAHCRGGIGRAGLVASCWMVKMGLVSAGGEAFEREETMRVVERTIDLIRKRRSVKAIETAHQVHFLVQYVAYLQQHATITTADELVVARPSTTTTA